MIDIQGKLDLSHIDRFYQYLEHSAPNTNLRLATHLGSQTIGAQAALCQFIITWAKQCPEASLQTHFDYVQGAEGGPTNFCQTDHGLIATIAAPDVQAANTRQSIRNEMRRIVLRELARLAGNPLKISRNTVHTICADDFSDDLLPSNLYFRGEVAGIESFESMLYLAHTRLSQLHSFTASKDLSNLMRDIGKIVFEIFRNTDQWARTDVYGSKVKNSVRGITTTWHTVTHNPTEEEYTGALGSKPIKNYLDSFNLGERANDYHMIEISVFDSGPGLAQRWLQREVLHDEPTLAEYDAVLGCLKKYASQSLDPNRGFGLSDTMALLSARAGFWRLRSGRLCLYRDFARNPYAPRYGDRNELYDWATGSSTDVKAHHPAIGALWTILVPVNF